MRRLRFIVVASVLAVFAVVTMASQGHAHTGPNCTALGSFDKTFSLNAAAGKWTILQHDEVDSTVPVVADALMYNGSIPGPTMSITEGDNVCVQITNNLTEETSVHFHGFPTPYLENDTDGVPAVGAGPSIPIGGTLAVHFTAPPAGAYMYHAHENTTRQILLGLYGRIIVETAGGSPYNYDHTWMLSEWRIDKNPHNNKYLDTVPAGLDSDSLPNYFTINGKSFDPKALPDADHGLVVLKQGQTARIRMIGIGQWPHAMHMHGRNFQVIAKDGVPLTTPQAMNTLTVNPGEIYDIAFTAGTTPADLGIWVFHCHFLDHATNNDVYPGGLVGAVYITP